MEQNTVENATSVEGLINYLEFTGERPANYMYEPPAGVPARSGRSNKHTMRVYDGRGAHLTLDGQGFAFVHHTSKVVDFYDPDEVQRVYYPEVAQLVMDVTGA